jgi:16S rRNA G966 N2-methylase RsmD
VSDYRNYIRKASGKDKFDLVFIDPPYAMQCSLDALKRLCDAGLLANGAIAVLESGEEEIDLSELSSFEVIKSTHYGKKSFVNILLYKEREQ